MATPATKALADGIFLAGGFYAGEDASAEHDDGADDDPVGGDVEQEGCVNQANGQDGKSDRINSE